MARLVWDETGSHYYETGISNGVLYVQNDDGTYQNGVVWNGITSVTENRSINRQVQVYTTESIYDSFYDYERVGITLEAYTYPRAFEQCEGNLLVSGFMSYEMQKRKKFGLCYKTKIGNDVSGNDCGFKIHIVYGCFANPSTKNYSTISDDLDAETFSWDINTTPIISYEGMRQTSIISFDSRDLTDNQIRMIEETLYGNDDTEARLPDPTEFIDMLWDAGLTWSKIQEYVDDETLETYKPIGSTISIDKWSDGTNSYEMPWIVADYEDDGSLILKSKYAIPTKGVAFDPPEALYYPSSSKSAGSYYVDIGDNYGGWDKTKSLYFNFTAALAARDQLCISGLNSINVDPTSAKSAYTYDQQGTTVKQTFTTSNNKVITYTQVAINYTKTTDHAYVRIANGAEGTLSSSATLYDVLSVSDYTAINSAWIKLLYKLVHTGNSSSNAYGLAFYDANKTYISGVNTTRTGSVGYGSEYEEVDIPSGAKYVRFTVLADETTYGTYAPKAVNGNSYATAYQPSGTSLGTAYPHAKNPSSSLVNYIDAVVNGSSNWPNSLTFRWLNKASNNSARTYFSRPDETGNHVDSGFVNGLSEDLQSILFDSSQRTYVAYTYSSGFKSLYSYNDKNSTAYIPSLTQMYCEELKTENVAIQYYEDLATKAGLEGKFQIGTSYNGLIEYALDNHNQPVMYRLRSSTGANGSDTFAVDSTGKIVTLAAKESSYVVVFIKIAKTV